MLPLRAKRLPDLLYSLVFLSVMTLSLWNLHLRLPLGSLCLKRHAALTQRLSELSPEASHEFARSLTSLRARLDLADYLLKERRLGNRLSLLAAQRAMTWMERDLRSLELGLDSVNARSGTVLKAHTSPVDGRDQPYWLQIPRTYHGDKPFPLIVHLHWHGWHRPFQGYPLPRTAKAIVVGPHARGSTDFMFVGEREVLDVIEEVKRDYQIDGDRVYLMGSSMGGTGSWQLAVHYPDAFAAIAPVSGNTNHAVWEEEWDWGSAPESSFRPIRNRLEDMLDPISFAANLEHVPVHCDHGEDDSIVPVGHSRTMTDRVAEAGGSVAYYEHADTGHSGFPKSLGRERLGWLLRHRRVRYPKHVRYRTASLGHARAYWVEVLGFRQYGDFAEVKAEVVEPRLIRVATRNVSRLALHLDGVGRRALGIVDGCHVVIDSARLPLATSPGSATLRRATGEWTLDPEPTTVARKRSGLSGPVEDAFLDSFLVVYGTTAESELENKIIRCEASHFVKEWKRRYVHPCRIKADHRVAEVDLERYNLILYGNEQANSVLARIADKLPIRVTPDGVCFHLALPNHSSPLTNHQANVGAKFCYPNPLNPSRYVVVFAATTWQGMFQINSRFGNWFKWGAYDNRNWFDFAVFDDRTVGPETFLQVGFFGDDWNVNPDTTWTGDANLRQSVVPRHVPRYAEAPQQSQVWLSDLLPVAISQPKGTVQFDRSFNGGPLRLVNTAVEHGLGVRVPSSVALPLDARFTHFSASVGIDYEGKQEIPEIRRTTETVQFRVYGDGRLLAESAELNADDPSDDLAADLRGLHRLTLTASPKSSHLWHFGSAVWANARVFH